MTDDHEAIGEENARAEKAFRARLALDEACEPDDPMIMNLTQHDATDDQLAEGVVELDAGSQGRVREFLTFEAIPDEADMQARAHAIAIIARDWAFGQDRRRNLQAMIGGASYFMSTLERVLRDPAYGIEPVYAFGKRESREIRLASHATRKVVDFKHLGFIPAAKGGSDG